MKRINPILRTDSYKAGHFDAYPPETRTIASYLTARGSDNDLYKDVTFFGLQPILTDYFCEQVTVADVEEAKSFFEHHGEPFNYDGWMRIATEFGGYLPLSIKALPEGQRAGFNEPLVLVENTVAGFEWLSSYVETMLMRVWYPSTVCTFSNGLRELLDEWVDGAGDSPVGADFMLHDFGARGSTSSEAAQMGGMAHLVNFQGTDTVEGIVAAMEYYNADMVGFSVVATEHSTMTAWSESGELEAFKRMIEHNPGKIVSIVSDSWDINRVLDVYLPLLKDLIISTGVRLVIRLDSGDPAQGVLDALEKIDKVFGHTLNSKGYMVLNNCGVLQGDGIDQLIVSMIEIMMLMSGWAPENIVFGMGGALHQKHNRDTFKFAYKACRTIEEDGTVNQIHKRSMESWKSSHTYEELDFSRLVEVFRDGEIVRFYTFDEVRANAKAVRSYE